MVLHLCKRVHPKQIRGMIVDCNIQYLFWQAAAHIVRFLSEEKVSSRVRWGSSRNKAYSNKKGEPESSSPFFYQASSPLPDHHVLIIPHPDGSERTALKQK